MLERSVKPRLLVPLSGTVKMSWYSRKGKPRTKEGSGTISRQPLDQNKSGLGRVLRDYTLDIFPDKMESKDIVQALEMKKECLAIVIGSILGDGYLTAHYNQLKKSQLWLKYNNRSLPYLKWLHQRLSPIGVGPLKPKKGYEQHQFLTKPSFELWQLRRIFYPKGIKIVPDKIYQFLTSPLSIAVWYMDDGSLDFREKYHCNASFATYNFKQGDCEKLKKVMRLNFGINARVHQSTMRGKTYWRLYIVSQSMKKFMKLVSPHIHPCFQYKIKL